ncbi:hypothetical protein B0O80DRAFT_465716 [Mortierella sp. GBAus27b]|nr:hypothetical protein B0O80DRAFT_465716 [Mortierella sp. GBAus27b]
MLQSGPQPQEAQTTNQQVSNSTVALDCPEILHAIGERILVNVWATTNERDLGWYHQLQLQTMLSCTLVSKFWCEVFTPLLWSVNETRRMTTVPRELLVKYSHHVRILNYWPEYPAQEPPMHTQLRHLTVEPGGYYWQKGHKKAIRRLVGANVNLETLQLSDVPLFKRESNEHQGSNDDDNKNMSDNNDDTDDDNMLGRTNPLGHLKSTLRELSLIQMDFREKEFYYALRDVAQGNLRSLELGLINGSFDLQGLVFRSLTRLQLWLKRTMNTDLYEIVGRAPHLDHLELYDAMDPDDWFEGSFVLCSLEPLAHFLRGTHPLHISKSRSAAKHWTRPQLATLRLHILHTNNQDSRLPEYANNPDYLELIRACSNTYNKFAQAGHLGSLRELIITLRNLDDDAKEAIEMHSDNLEVLRITIEYNWGRVSVEHGQALAKIFQSCRRLKVLEYRSGSLDVPNISTMMESLIEEHSKENNRRSADANGHIPGPPWNCPDLETLRIYSTAPSVMERLEEERWFVDDETNGDNNNIHGFSPWTIPSFQWDPTVDDGTAFLLDTMEARSRFSWPMRMGRPKNGENLIKRFLHYVAPSRKLKNLQLAQLKFVKPCACESCNGK